VALGFAVVVAASPILFEVIRWIDIIYLVYLAYHLVRSAFRTRGLTVSANKAKSQLSKGFVTPLLNLKGIMIYVAILPQFTDKHGSVTIQAAIPVSHFHISVCAHLYDHRLHREFHGLEADLGRHESEDRRWMRRRDDPDGGRLLGGDVVANVIRDGDLSIS
jgi:hypothetical protein